MGRGTGSASQLRRAQRVRTYFAQHNMDTSDIDAFINDLRTGDGPGLASDIILQSFTRRMTEHQAAAGADNSRAIVPVDSMDDL